VVNQMFVKIYTDEIFTYGLTAEGVICYRDVDKFLARPDWGGGEVKVRHFSSDAEVIAAAETWLDGQPSEFFFFLWLAKVRVSSL
jgi:hypothetical protein